MWVASLFTIDVGSVTLTMGRVVATGALGAAQENVCLEWDAGDAANGLLREASFIEHAEGGHCHQRELT